MRIGLILLSALLLGACTREKNSRAQDESVQAGGKGGGSVTEIQLVRDSDLQECFDKDGWLALVQAQEVKILNRGTRSEKYEIKAQVLQVIHGKVSGTIEVGRFVQGTSAAIVRGGNYIMAGAGEFGGGHFLYGVAAVPKGMEKASVEAHAKRVAELGKAAP